MKKITTLLVLLLCTFGGAKADSKADLKAAIDKGKSYSIGTNLGQYSGNGAQTLLDHLKCEEWYEWYNDATCQTYTQRINEAIETLHLNIPKTNTFLRVKSVATGKYLGSKNGGDRNSAAFTDDPNEGIFYYDSNKYFANFVNGAQLANISPNGSVNGFLAYGDNVDATEISFDENTSQLGTYNVNYFGGQRTLCATNSDDYANADSKNKNTTAFTLEEVNSLPVTITAAGYATLHLPVAVTIPTDVHAYTGKKSADNTSLTLTEVSDVIPANTPVILEGKPDTYSFEIMTGEVTPIDKGDLTGTIQEAKKTSENDIFTLQVINKKVGMYKFTGDNLKGFKAYLPASSAVGAEGFAFSFGPTTGINAVEVGTTGMEIFDLSGRRVEKATKGLYIVNGKKMLVK